MNRVTTAVGTITKPIQSLNVVVVSHLSDSQRSLVRDASWLWLVFKFQVLLWVENLKCQEINHRYVMIAHLSTGVSGISHILFIMSNLLCNIWTNRLIVFIHCAADQS